MSKTFKPMLAPNQEISIEELPFPLYASYKYDGIRCIFKDGEMVSRSLKSIPNVRLHEKFATLKEYSKERGVILDGELYDHTMTFPDLSGLVRRLDTPIPETLKFYAFDEFTFHNIGLGFQKRLFNMALDIQSFPNICEGIKHEMIDSPLMCSEYFDRALADGFEGLILRDPEGRYKFGRGTIKEGLIFKLKPYTTFDAKVIEVVQGTEVDPNAEKKINELGYSETSKKKGDRIPVEKACDFVVMHEGEKRLKVMIAMTDDEKKEVWKNRESYIGRWIEYKGLLVGSKDLPRHPVFLRFRDDKD